MKVARQIETMPTVSKAMLMPLLNLGERESPKLSLYIFLFNYSSYILRLSLGLDRGMRVTLGV